MNISNKNKEISKNFFYNLMYEVIIILSPLIVTPYVSRVLGVELIGVRSYTFAILTYFELFANLGIAIYGQREIAKVMDDKQARSNVFLSLLTIKFISFLIIFIVYDITFFGFNLLSNYKTVWLIWLIHLFEAFFNVTWYFQGCEKFKLIAIRGIFLRTLQIILTLLFVKDPSDFVIYLIIYATIPLLQGASLWPFLINNIELSEFKNIKLKKHIKSIFVFFIPTIATAIYSNVDKIMLGSMLNTPIQTGYYDSAQSIVLIATTIFTSIYTVMRSRISAEVANNQNRSIDFFIRIALLMVFSITLGIFAISDSFITIFFGYEYEPVVPLLRIFCIVIFLMGISGFISAAYIVPYNKQKYISIFYVFATIINVLLNALLISKFEAIGAIIGSIAAEGAVFIGCIFLSRKEIPIKDYFSNGWKYSISGLVMFVLVYILDCVFPNQIIYLLLEILIGVGTFILILILLNDKLIMSLIEKNNTK